MKKLLFSAIFIAVGAAIAVWGFGVLKKSKESATWPAVEGTVVFSDVIRETKRSDGKRKVIYKAEVLYDYVVDGTAYSANKVSFVQGGSSNPGPARQIATYYSAGKRVPVYYDPVRPDTAVLEPGVTWKSYLPLGGGLLFILAGVGVLFGGRR
ncbi:MAG TPA: DUF3592 domain-containing protein [Tichowtungia sp.]|nr:DUF3592 domain-containing protein [Tichowtungia sp.]